MDRKPPCCFKRLLFYSRGCGSVALGIKCERYNVGAVCVSLKVICAVAPAVIPCAVGSYFEFFARFKFNFAYPLVTVGSHGDVSAVIAPVAGSKASYDTVGVIGSYERLYFFVSFTVFSFFQNKAYAVSGLSSCGSVLVLSYNESVQTCAADNNGVIRPAESVFIFLFLPGRIEYRSGSQRLNVSGLRVGDPLRLGIYLLIAVDLGVALRYLESI